jgi:hypothetical protein
MANIAQMINVLQAMIVTDKEKMVLTPTYHVFRMYLPFQDATSVPVTFDAGTYTNGDIRLPRLDAIAGKDASGKLWLASRISIRKPAEIEAESGRHHSQIGTGETLTAPKVDSVNSFEAAATSWVLSIALFTDRTKGTSNRLARHRIDSSIPLIFCGLSLGDLEGRSRSSSRASRPVLMAARRIEPFLRTGLPLLPRRTTKNLFQARGRYPDDT